MLNLNSLQYKNIVDCLKLHDDRHIIFYGKKTNQKISFGQLHDAVTQSMAVARDAGIFEGARVGLIVENGYAALLVDLVLLGIGCTVIQMPEGTANETLSLVGENRLDFLIIDPAFSSGLCLDQFTELNLLALSNLLIYSKKTSREQQESKLHDVPSVIFSSGTSGKIKKILVSGDGVVYNAKVFLLLSRRDKTICF